MADGKSKNSKQDLGRLSSGDHYEIRDFAFEFDISLGQVHDLIRRHGNDRATLECEARKLKRIRRSAKAAHLATAGQRCRYVADSRLTGIRGPRLNAGYLPM